ncbi:hypothetical protein HDE_02728 [Halotydeus destructor]|nr:hypothetical protein HDE_02728 [Halotydeus destructor]
MSTPSHRSSVAKNRGHSKRRSAGSSRRTTGGHVLPSKPVKMWLNQLRQKHNILVNKVKHQKRQLVTLRGQLSFNHEDHLSQSYRERFSDLQASLGDQCEKLGELQLLCQRFGSDSTSGDVQDATYCRTPKSSSAIKQELEEVRKRKAGSLSVEGLKHGFALAPGSTFSQPPSLSSRWPSEDNYTPSSAIAFGSRLDEETPFCLRSGSSQALLGDAELDNASQETYLISDNPHGLLYREVGANYVSMAPTAVGGDAANSFCDEAGLSYEATISDIHS